MKTTNEQQMKDAKNSLLGENIVKIGGFFFLWLYGFFTLFLPWDEDTGFLHFIGILCLIAAFCFTFCISDCFREYKKVKAMTLEQAWQYKKAKEQQRQQEAAQEQQRQREQQQQQREFQAKRRKLMAQGIPSCPICGSTSIATVNRGYSIMTGFYGSGQAVNVCQVCGHRFKPGS